MSNAARCGLCPHRCILGGADGEPRMGLCGIRSASGDMRYGLVTALAVDPIEKKPLYHWRPGSSILSAGFAGCNLRCPFCQNWHISQQADAPGRYMPPDELIDRARPFGQIAYTYSEPLVHAEYLLACMKRAREEGTANILVSNGCVNDQTAQDILALTDAANIDLKSFSAETYAKVLGGDLETVKNCIRTAVSLGVHLEITTLAVPGLNDGEAELDEAAAFIADLKPGGVPWHLSAYHPGWKWKAPPTDPVFLAALARRHTGHGIRPRIDHIYIGNAAAPAEFRDTFCRRCGALLIQRSVHSIDAGGLKSRDGGFACTQCGEPAPIRR